MSRRPAPLPSSLENRPFTVAEAARLGVPYGRLRAGDLTTPHRGVRTAAPAAGEMVARCRAFAARMDAGLFFSHATAALIFGLSLPGWWRPNDLHVSCVLPRRAVRAEGVVGHALVGNLVRVVEWNGLRAVHPVDAWCQLAATLSVRDLVIAGDALVRRQHPLTTVAELDATVARFGGRRGSRTLRAALQLVRPDTDSPRETELRLDILEAGMPEPKVNVPIYDDDGALVAIGDLVFVEYDVVVEYDGEHHRLDDAQYARDVDRVDDLSHLGMRVIRVNKRHRGVRRRAVLQRIREALIERGWRPSASSSSVGLQE